MRCDDDEVFDDLNVRNGQDDCNSDADATVTAMRTQL